MDKVVVDYMWIHTMIIFVLILFMFVGIVDKIMGNRRGYGKAFEEGFQAMGPLALVMIGMISVAPVIANVLRPVITPFFIFLGADPSMFPGMLLAIDMGGYPLAIELSESTEAALFSGIILSTLLGPTFVFTVPVALGFINKNDYPVLAKGIMIGLIPIPLGAMLAGMIAGFPIDFLLRQLFPVLLFVGVIICGLIWMDQWLIKVFTFIGKGIMALVCLVIGIVAINELTPFEVVQGLTPFSESMEIVGLIVLALTGAFPLVYFLKEKILPLMSPIIRKSGITDVAWVGFISSLAHSIPMYKNLNQMDEQSKLMNIAFSVSGAFVLGGHLGFTAALEPQMVMPMMAGKLTAGVLSVVLAYLYSKRLLGRRRLS
ncbi:ethanolamine utilization protein EutH [Salipaludibacillus keqinensis]|uniref:Ethanolamine utilization protein EutH n=1 Tax=Salipaludibacillus keqinensis TaxID=2045207 RepID=A0A323TMT5_9BACI|nr:ethanolamine utilization protein EutH [Salipaludibacillus keqinensis]PYZ94013.1 ethanolamine utilization protein EutH [Salipaludibacillus keqinensis]